MANFEKVTLLFGYASASEKLALVEAVHHDPSYQSHQLLEPYRDSAWDFIALVDAWAVPKEDDNAVQESGAGEGDARGGGGELDDRDPAESGEEVRGG